ncbi:hypothetical protein ACGF5F_32685 [Streptomyces sp. NPDC047821]|uniref:hypothetical protein n=1 Tax=Streptomyces sp. NPDC047821 TaxID=3365488 RepID=UPI00371FDA9B
MAGWQRRMAAVPGPWAASGEASNGQPVTVELFVDGAWVDITSYVLTRDGGGRIEISRGQSDEGAQVERSTCTFELNNRDGRFSPRNPSGPYYGKIGRNSPLRVSVPDPGTGAKNYRFWGEVTKWPQAWDLAGVDFWVRVEAYGPLSRLEKGRIPTHSVLYNALTTGTVPGLRAYWPCEDSGDVTTIRSLVPTAQDMTITGVPLLQNYEFFYSSDPLPIMSDCTFTGLVDAYDPVTSCQLRFLLAVPTVGLSDGQVIASIWMDSLDVETWELYYVVGSQDEGQVALRPLDGDGATLAGGVSEFGDIRGRNLRVSVELVQNGANVDCTVRMLDLSNDEVTTGTGSLASKTLTRVTRVDMAPAQVLGSATMGMPDTAIGHVTLQNEITAIDDLGDRLDPAGEAAGRRFQRICDERGLAFDHIGDLDATELMGSQQKRRPVELLQECVAVDGGIMYESLTNFGLGYRTRASMYNQEPALAFSYTDHLLAEVPLPVEDDRYIRNSIDAVRSFDAGDTAHAELTTGPLSTLEPPAGVGEYGQQAEVNVPDDSYLPSQAGWRLFQGTIDEARFPQISFNLARQQITGEIKATLLNLRPGDRILITDPPATQPPDDISLVVYGWARESIDHFEHKITLNCAPESAWRVATVDDEVYGRVDTAGSQLLEDVTSGASSLTVLTTEGPWWTTDTAETPFDIRVGGEVMTVSAIQPSRYDTFTRTTSNGWGTSDSGHSWTTAGGLAAEYSTASGEGRHVCGTLDISRRTILTAPTDDFDITCDMTANALSTGASQFAGIMARYLSIDNLYQARLEFTTSNTVVLAIRKRLAGVETTVGSSYTTTITHAAGQYLTVRFQGAANNLRAKAWLATAEEPLEWQIDTTDGSFAAGSCGCRSIVAAGNTNVSPTLAYDNFRFNNPQTFTVTRSVNAVTKAHSAGADVRLAHPAIVAL